MNTSIRYCCERCGAEFASRSDCAQHEHFCGEYPASGLYRLKSRGYPTYVRVDMDSLTMVRVDTYPFSKSVEHLCRFDPGEVEATVGDAKAIMEIHDAYANVERAVLMALSLPPYDRKSQEGSA